MGQPFYLIDGYNLMHALGYARVSYGPGDLERCRWKLLAFLGAHLTDPERARCTVVFDAREAPPYAARAGSHQQMSVQFADPGQEADDYIELFIATHSAAQQIILVSSDHRLQKAVKKRRGRSVDSEVFAAHLEIAGRPSITQSTSFGHPADSTQSPKPAEVEFWLTEFGEIDAGKLVPEEPAVLPGVQALPPDPKTAGRPASAKGASAPPPSAADIAGGDAGASARPPRHGVAPDDWSRNLNDLQQQLADSESLEKWLNETPTKRVE